MPKTLKELKEDPKFEEFKGLFTELFEEAWARKEQEARERAAKEQPKSFLETIFGSN